MIRFSKKILMSLIVIMVAMSLYNGGSKTTIHAEGAQKYYRSERMGVPAVSINDSLTTSFITNGYYDVTRVPGHYSEWHTMSINLPNLNNEITNFNIATIDEAYFKININYTGTDNNVSGYRFQYFDKLYNATNIGGNFYEVEIPYDARNMVQSQLINFTPLDIANGNGGYIPTNGATRFNGVTVSVDYHYDVDDPISPIVDGAGALVESVNLAKPNITGKTLISDGVYELCNQSDFSLLYDTRNNIFTINGTSTETCVFYRYSNPGVYTISYYYISGVLSTYQGLNADIASTRTIFNIRSTTYMNNISGNASITDNGIAILTDSNSTFVNFKFRLQLEEGTEATPWMHPDAIHYDTASIQQDLNLATPAEIRSNIYAFDDVDGNISDRLKIVNTARDYSAWLANRYGLNINDVLSAYDADTLDILITNSITLTKAYIDAQFLIYKEDTYWHQFDEGTIIPKNLTEAYKMLVYVGDNAGNYTFLEIFVFINDVTAPVFDESNPLTVTVSYKITFDFDNWLLTLIITDNHDDDVARVVHVDGYTSNKSTPGNYTVTVRATDETGNIKDQAFTFKVIDDIKPTFNGPESIFKPQSSQMTVNNILTRYTAFDEISGNVTSRIIILEDNYTGRGHIANTYTVTLQVSDLAGNIQTFIIYITVSDDIPPVIYVADGYFIQVSAAYILTIEGIRDILVATGRLNIVSATTWTVLVNEYQGNENKPGIYTISVRFSQTSGVTEVHSVAVNVKNASTDPGGTFQPESNFNIILYAGIGIGAVFIFIALRKKR